MATRTEAYVDTSAFIAALDRSDSRHTLYARLFSAPPQLLTSSLVIAEGHGWFLRRYHVEKALQFLRFIQALSPLSVIAFEAADLAVATPLLAKFGAQKLTLADTHGLILMKRQRINACWSTDCHLGLTGVPLVR